MKRRSLRSFRRRWMSPQRPQKMPIFFERKALISTTCIDDANLPAPEHIPMENETTTGVHQTWGWSGFSNREAASMQNSPASMTKKWYQIHDLPLGFPLILFPLISLNLKQQKERVIGLGEFAVSRIVDVWRHSRDSLDHNFGVAESRDIDCEEFDGAPVWLHCWMSKRRLTP